MREPGSEEAIALWELVDECASSVIGYAEARGAIARIERERRLSAPAARRAAERLDTAWGELVSVDVDRPLGLHAGAMTARHGLRALDAVHLASALALAEADPILASWDGELRRAALAEGLPIAPI